MGERTKLLKGGGSSSSNSSGKAGELDDFGDIQAPIGPGYESSQLPNSYGIAYATKWAKQTALWLEKSDDTDPVRCLTGCCDGFSDFRPRKVKAPIILVWLAMQGIGLIFQFNMLGEIGRHLSQYQQTLDANCGPQFRRKNVCLGPSWNMSFSGVLKFPSAGSTDGDSDYDFVIPTDQSFDFETASNPPTFLVGVEPLKPNDGAKWKLSIGGSQSRNGWGDHLPMQSGSGSKYMVMCQRYMRSTKRWKAQINLVQKYDSEVQVYAYVVDSQIKHLEDIHAQKQCSFEKSWQNFSERDSGVHHAVLTNTWWATFLFLVVSLGTFSLMLHRFLYFVEGSKLFSRVVVLKFLLQDFPQQFCVACYLYAWYADNGMRCQMCLFHPSHCEDEHPLHAGNLLLCVATLLSASSNQLLLQPKSKRYDEDEECFLYCTRMALFSISVLPFSTAVLFMSSSLLHLRSPFIYFIVAFPTVLGWGTILCVPLFNICEDDMLL